LVRSTSPGDLTATGRYLQNSPILPLRSSLEFNLVQLIMVELISSPIGVQLSSQRKITLTISLTIASRRSFSRIIAIPHPSKL